jgi:hypothetical protein
VSAGKAAGALPLFYLKKRPTCFSNIPQKLPWKMFCGIIMAHSLSEKGGEADER